LERPHRIEMKLVDGPFRKLHGQWDFFALEESASKITLALAFDPTNRLIGPALARGFQGLADRMVDDFVRIADLDE
jgi:ribosome-associated toxin RatA of RatAB toxin-antitoxin module